LFQEPEGEFPIAAKMVTMSRYLNFTREDYLKMDLDEFNYTFNGMKEILKAENKR
jgi:hypothetical protein